MTDIFVSDLFGYTISNNSTFVIINSRETDKLLKRVAKNNNTSIWEYDKSRIDDILKLRNVDSTLFVPLGHVLYKQDSVPTTLILANKSIAKSPTGFSEIGPYDNGKIYRPIYDGDENYSEIGLIYSKDIPSTNIKIYLIPNSMIIKLPNNNNKIDMNDFFLLSSGTSGIKTINKSALIDNNFVNMKLTHSSNKYLTMIDENNKALLKSKQHSASQLLSYNAQGELTTQGKCLTYSDDNKPVFFGTCANNKKQKWHIFDNKISPQYESAKCLTAEKNDIYIKQCNENDDNQSFNTGHTDESDSTNYSWDKYHGKTVVLVESNNPWYINNTTTVQLENKYKENEIYDEVNYKNHATYKTNFILNPTGHHMGFGVSYADREGIPCDKIEKFNEGKSQCSDGMSEDTQIIFIMLLLLFMVIAYKVWLTSRK